MNNTTQTSVSKLEMLANETLIFLYEYLTPQDLMRSFWNLNSRLNDAIISSKLCFTLKYNFRNSSSLGDDDVESFRLFASHIYSFIIDYTNKVDLSHCCQLRSLKMWYIEEEQLAAIRSSIMPHLQRLVIRSSIYNSKKFFERIFNEPFSSLQVLEVSEIEIKPESNYKPLLSVKSLSGFCCKWSHFKSILALFPGLRRLHLSLYTYRENPRWASIEPMILPLENIHIELSSKMVTPDDDSPCGYTIDTRLRHVKLNAHVSKRNNNTRLIDILPQTVERIENIIDQTKTSEMISDKHDDNLEALVEAHLACQNVDWCLSHMSNGWRLY